MTHSFSRDNVARRQKQGKRPENSLPGRGSRGHGEAEAEEDVFIAAGVHREGVRARA